MLRVQLKPSRILAAVYAAAHLAAAGLLIPLTLPLWAKLVIALAIAASLARVLRHTALLRSPTACVALELTGGDAAAVQTRDSRWRRARILGTTYVSPLLTVVNLELGGRRMTRHVVVVSDSIAADDFRKLRVRLRWDYRTAADEPRDPL